jgi:hypothetical protein
MGAPAAFADVGFSALAAGPPTLVVRRTLGVRAIPDPGPAMSGEVTWGTRWF